MVELKIDKEFESLIPALSATEFNQLRDNILEVREVLDPIKTWQGIIIDGHNRWKIIQENPDIPYKTYEMIFNDRDEAKTWIINNQLGRRNLSGEQQSNLRGKRVELEKKKVGEHDGNQYTVECPQNDDIPKKSKRTVERLADEYGVSKATIERDAKFSKGIDALAEVSEEAAEKVLKGGSGVTKTEIMGVPKMEVEERKEFAERVMNPPQKKTKRKGNPSSLVPGGFTKEELAERKKISNIIDSMYDTETESTFSVDDLISEIMLNGKTYVAQLGNEFVEHEELIIAENIERLEKAVDTIIGKIEKIKEKYL